LIKILQGKKKQVLSDLKKEMKKLSSHQNFEKAVRVRDQIKSLEKVFSHASILEQKPEINEAEIILQKILKAKKDISHIEAYDVSNIQGQTATGSMVTFINGSPSKNLYRKFKIKISGKPDDTAMIKEILSRRFNHPEWSYPDLILVDGGKAQLNAARKSIKKLKIPIIALAKKNNELFVEGRKNPLLLKNLPRETFNLILQLRDEAHRFAIKYHHKLRKIDLLPKS
ncbi:MAG: UvrB/UvrC motif-containing protein, partial [Candidatus Paceibacterota bacterium]